MKKTFLQSIRSFFVEPQWKKVRGIFWFFIITLVIHLGWRFWANTLHYSPVAGLMSSISAFFVFHLHFETGLILKNILNIKITIFPDSSYLVNNIWLRLSDSATGLKQIFQFVLLILIIPGPWKHKAWFIPIGIIVIHLTNIFRIISLVVIAIHWPQQFHYAHENYLRLLFYVVIFGLWLVWVEKISIRKAKT